MSYNTRRGTPNYAQQNSPSASSVGQRRQVSNNFVPGGQLAGSQQQKASGTPQQQRQGQQQTGINYRNQGQGQGQQQNYHSTQFNPQSQQAPQVKQEPKPVAVQPQTPVKPPVTPKPPVASKTPLAPKTTPSTPIPGANPPPPEEDVMETNEDGSKKKFWQKGKGFKISKAEKVRRRNLRLSKILQPKNAVMILNELVRGCTYTVEELPVKVDSNQFRGNVSFDGQDFAGTGRTKIAAKNAAAETALKFLVKNKQLTCLKKEEEGGDGDGDEKMEIGEDEGSQVMPWSHIASFAMYKLFSTWGEDPNIVNKVSAQDIANAGAAKGAGAAGIREPNPAKKMPPNPETMNPLMLMHQMMPNALWKEVGKTGAPPNVVFTFNVTVEDNTFSGTASSKKEAKKLAAFAACHEILKIEYSPDVWAPLH